MVAARDDALIASYPARDLEPLDQPQFLELLQSPVDTGPPHPGAALAQLLVDIERGDRAVVAGQHLHHGAARAALAQAGAAQLCQGVVGPGHVGGSGHLKLDRSLR